MIQNCEGVTVIQIRYIRFFEDLLCHIVDHIVCKVLHVLAAHIQEITFLTQIRETKMPLLGIQILGR